ncbi:MotE family protein [Pedomonas sp. V897]|uniref:MotE family protein n=1 Tax=Pedomonas sp. V897 TaxID=3446482 RepID=UPI003EDEF3CF
MKAWPVSFRPFPLMLAAGAGIFLVNVADVIARAPGNEPAAAQAQTAQTAQTPVKRAAASGGANAAPAQQLARAAPPQNRVEADLLEDMARQRAKTTTSKDDLEMRERLLEAAEKRVDAKIAELRQLEAQLKELTGVRDEQASKQFASLVKVYETMKPRDAARIFERLDINVQLAVAHRMKEAKMAAILAEMNPDAAKSLTMALAERANTAS